MDAHVPSGDNLRSMISLYDYEHHSDPLLPRAEFAWRVAGHLLVAMAILGPSLGMGVLGYHLTEDLGWIDSLLNASMILGGMGPVDRLVTPEGKLFASFYALYSGVVFLVVASVIIAPVVHRVAHKLHLDEEEMGREGSPDSR